MKQVSANEIESIARSLVREHKSWHYHLFTPACRFNDRKEHAFVLENGTDGERYVSYSETPAMDLGKRLLSILHGEDMLTAAQEIRTISPSTEKILRTASRLNARGKFWHHHVFFPLCRYNRHPGKWNITFEDQEHGTVLESVSDEVRLQDQKEIERLYYLQKTIV